MKRILVADDEPHATRLLKRRLEGAGYEVDAAPDGEAALDKLEARPYDVLVTDICMPRMDGRELCERVRKRSVAEPLIFVLTSRPEAEFRDWTRNFPNLEFMEKPISLKRLIARISQRLEEAPPEAEPA